MEDLTVRGETIPVLGFGTWQLRGDQCREGGRHALELGYRMIDTSPNYGNEEQVGAGIDDSGVDREEIFLVTKVERDDLDADGVGRSVKESLGRLGTDYIDLLLVHHPNPQIPLNETLGAMQQERQAGRIRHIGVSNFSTEQLDEALELSEIFCDQEEYQPGQDRRAYLERAQQHDFAFMAYSPLGRGDLVRGSSEKTLARIGQRYGKSATQVALRWLVQQPKVVTIPRSSDAEHRRENLEIFDFTLSDDEMGELSSPA